MVTLLPVVNYSGNNELTYSWDTNSTLSATEILNPIARPVSSTTYTLSVTDGICEDTALYIVNIIEVLGIEKSIISKLFIYPNPASDKLFIHHVYSSKPEIIIHDIQGRQVLHKTIDSDYIDISSLQKGIYSVKLIDNQNVLINKLIKE